MQGILYNPENFDIDQDCQSGLLIEITIQLNCDLELIILNEFILHGFCNIGTESLTIFLEGRAIQ
jgi:hypothetical protein